MSIYNKRYPLGQVTKDRVEWKKYLQPSVIPKMVHDRHWQELESGSQDLGGPNGKWISSTEILNGAFCRSDSSLTT
jgi:hypothetical protein